MKRLPLFLVLMASLAACSRDSGYKEVRQYTIEQFMNTTGIAGGSISHDDQTILLSSNKTGIYNAYTVPVSGGDPVQITDSKDNSVFVISWFPNDKRFLYRSDQGGNEIHHIYVRNENKTSRDLTPDAKARAIFYGWSDDEKSFFYGSNKRDPKYTDVYEMELSSFKATLIYQNDEGLDVTAISPDKRYFALIKSITTNNNEMYLFDRQAKEQKHLSKHEGDATFSPQTFSVDSKSLYYLTNGGSEFDYLRKYDIGTGIAEKVDEAPWDIMFMDVSRTGKYLVTGINNDGRTEIKVVETATGKPVTLPNLPNADITSVAISRSEKLMTMYVNGSTAPSNLFVYNLETGANNRITNTMNPEVDQSDLVEASVVRYKSFDGVEIPSIYYKPHHIKPGEKAPALVWVHGGPGGQSRVGYSPLLQYLVNHGYVVIAVNNRGSSGYGKTFFAMDDLKHGQEDLDDCVWAKRYLASTGYVDTTRIGIIGGSYGGYMVCAALAFRPTEFAVGVNIFGVTNWVRTLKSIPPWWESFREALYKELGDPFQQEDFLRAKSPLFHADKIQRPMTVLQGANDPRVLKVESDEIVEAIRKNNVPVEYVVFPDEGHGFVKKENQIKGYKAILDFVDTHLKRPSTP
ncbi:MAG: alpha/beta fold hydrolase [Bacteroidota bacterium]